MSTNTGVNIISLSDKIDHLVGFFIIGQLPQAERSIWLKKISIKYYTGFDRGKYINKFR